jgi:simple sugar transport system permease protein
VGNDPDKARLVGIEPRNIRAISLIATGFFTGIAGTLLVSNAGNFTENMTAGSGYIGLAALIIGGWRPIPALLAAFGFAVFDALQVFCQGIKVFGVVIPSQFWQSLPYVVTVIALAGFLGRTRPPAGLGKA